MPRSSDRGYSPPTLALLCHGLWLVGAVELLRGPGARLVARPRVWRGGVAANGVAMTAFLWHLAAMLGVYGVYGAMIALDVPLPEPATGAWWAQVPVRIAVAAAVTAGLVAVFRTFERPVSAIPGKGSGPVSALGVTLCLFGVLGVSMVGFGGLLEGHTAMLIAVRVSAPAAVAMALGGWLLVERAGRRRSG